MQQREHRHRRIRRRLRRFRQRVTGQSETDHHSRETGTQLGSQLGSQRGNQRGSLKRRVNIREEVDSKDIAGQSFLAKSFGGPVEGPNSRSPALGRQPGLGPFRAQKVQADGRSAESALGAVGDDNGFV